MAPLATRDELRREGVLQNLCIAGGGELTRMVDACASGRAYLVSIRDAATGASLSTAEVHPSRALRGGTVELRMRQHKAKDNGPPSAARVAALHEALAWVAGREGQDHLDAGQRFLWKRQRLNASANGDIDRDVVPEALRVGLGATLYQAVVIEVKKVAADQLGPTPDRSPRQ